MNRDPIDELLDDPPPLPDDGFTQRVMSSLPPTSPPTWSPLRWLPTLGAAVVVAALAPEVAGMVQLLADGSSSLGASLLHALARGESQLPISMALLATALALGAAALGSWLVSEPP